MPSILRLFGIVEHAHLDMLNLAAPIMTSENMRIEAFAHCDGPCGVYDPASARVAGEAVQSMTTKMLTLAENHGSDCG